MICLGDVPDHGYHVEPSPYEDVEQVGKAVGSLRPEIIHTWAGIAILQSTVRHNPKRCGGKFVYNGTVSKILGLVGMTPKVIVRSGERDPRKLDKLGGRVLGHP